MNPDTQEQGSTDDVWARFRAAAATPGTHARDYAKTVGLTEAELLVHGRGQGVEVLRAEWEAIFAELHTLGAVKSMTRNEHIVLEHWGRYQGGPSQTDDAQAEDDAATEPHIDLRLFFRHWGFAFALSEAGANGTRRSLQFFDRHGDSAHKLYLESDKVDAFRALVDRFRDDAPAPLVVAPVPAPAVTEPQVDAATFQAEWDALKDTHEFVMLLARHKLPRVQALRLAGSTRATEVAPGALRQIITSVAEHATPFMIFVANRGLMQIFTGTVRAVKAQNGWVNVFDKGLNLHAREAGIASSFIVRKPTSDGIVTSLELYDAEGGLLGLLFGERSFGQPESPDWRARLDELQR